VEIRLAVEMLLQNRTDHIVPVSHIPAGFVPAFLLVLVSAPYDLVVRRRMKIKDLPNWPPEPRSAFNASYKSPTSDQAVLKELVRVQDNSVTFTTTFEGKQFTYDYEVANSRLAKTLVEVLARNIGKTLMQLGAVEVDA
jgi:hypothetical protein